MEKGSLTSLSELQNQIIVMKMVSIFRKVVKVARIVRKVMKVVSIGRKVII